MTIRLACILLIVVLGTFGLALAEDAADEEMVDSGTMDYKP